MQELTIREIAEKLAITPQAAKIRLYRKGIKPLRLIGQTGIYELSVIDKIREVAPVGRPPKKIDKPDEPAETGGEE